MSQLNYSTEGETDHCRVHSGSNRYIYVLAMNWGSPSDRVRLRRLEKESGAIITTVSESNEKTEKPHISCNFKAVRGLRNLISALRENGGEVLLDYFWLEKNYYMSNYGMNWFSSKVPLLVKAGATKITLPVDGGLRNKDGHNMQKMLKSTTDDWSYTSKEDNSLWMASNGAYIQKCLLKLKRGSNAQMTRDYLNPETPFVSISAHLDTTCIEKTLVSSQKSTHINFSE
jgi:hypothetical protein